MAKKTDQTSAGPAVGERLGKSDSTLGDLPSDGRSSVLSANERPIVADRPPIDSSRIAMIEVPLASTTGYVAMEVRTRLSALQAHALRELFDGLVERAATLKNGAKIADHRSALKWLLEQVAGLGVVK